ncbi:MAG: hypothetical protein QXX42_01485 [Thermoplasmatales archaeon]
MNEVKEQNNETKNEDTWKLMFDQIQKLQQQQQEMMERIKQESTQKLNELQSKIDTKKQEIAKLQQELTELEQERSKILSLLGMKTENSNSRSKHNIYEYNGIKYYNATQLIRDLPEGIQVLNEYPHSSWALIIRRIIENNDIPPRIQGYKTFLETIKNVKIL